MLRERYAFVAPGMLWIENSSFATRQCRFRHCEEMRVRTAPPKGIRFASPESSRLSSPAGYECNVWICKNLVVDIINLPDLESLFSGIGVVPPGNSRGRFADGFAPLGLRRIRHSK